MQSPKIGLRNSPRSPSRILAMSPKILHDFHGQSPKNAHRSRAARPQDFARVWRILWASRANSFGEPFGKPSSSWPGRPTKTKQTNSEQRQKTMQAGSAQKAKHASKSTQPDNTHHNNFWGVSFRFRKKRLGVIKNKCFVEAPCSFLKKRARRLGEKHNFQDTETKNGARTASPSLSQTSQAYLVPPSRSPVPLLFSLLLSLCHVNKHCNHT